MCEKGVLKGYLNAQMKSFGRLFNRSCAVKAEKLSIEHEEVDIDGSNIHGSGGSSSSSSSSSSNRRDVLELQFLLCPSIGSSHFSESFLVFRSQLGPREV